MKYSVLLNMLLIAVIGIYLYTHNDNTVEHKQDVKPPEYTIIKPIDNTNISDLISRANAQIEVFRSLDGSNLTIRATDGYKQTIVHDKFYSRPRSNFAFVGFGIGNKFDIIYSVGYARRLYFDSFYVGSYVSFNRSSLNSVNAVVGYSF